MHADEIHLDFKTFQRKIVVVRQSIFYPKYRNYTMKGNGAQKYFLVWLLFQNDPFFRLIEEEERFPNGKV